MQFQKMHTNKYIQHLEKRVDGLEAELAKYREQSRIESSPFNNTPNQYIDLGQIKKIEPKQPNKQSTKTLNKNVGHMIKTDNLNAKTAEILKTSPNNMGNTRPIMAVNINNVVKNEMTSMERHLFRQGSNLQVMQREQMPVTPVVQNNVYLYNLEKET